MPLLAKREKQELLKLARRTLERKILENRVAVEAAPNPNLQKASGVFVTLHRQGQLRGCIGRIRSDQPMFRGVQEMAVAAATQDPRFEPVSPAELPSLEIEVSVLSAPQPLKDIEELKIGEHGLIVSFGGSSGLLLPQVATEQGWDKNDFLAHTCLKAGLPEDFWKNSQARIEFFSAEVFSEGELLGE